MDGYVGDGFGHGSVDLPGWTMNGDDVEDISCDVVGKAKYETVVGAEMEWIGEGVYEGVEKGSGCLIAAGGNVIDLAGGAGKGADIGGAMEEDRPAVDVNEDAAADVSAGAEGIADDDGGGNKIEMVG